jgi:fused signal recognition particle receptor
MFDGLKEKLNNFRKDVEETAEEKADAESAAPPEDAVEADADAETEARTRSETERRDEAPPEAETDAETETDADAGDDVDFGTGETGTDRGRGTESAATATTPTSDAGAAADEGGTEASAAGDPPGTDAERTTVDPDDRADTASTAASASTPEDASASGEDDGDRSAETLAGEGVETAVEEATGGAGGRNASRLQRAKAFATGRIIIEEEDLEDPLWELEMALLGSDVEMNVAEAILETIREKMIGESRKQVDTTAELVSEALSDALLEVISVGQFDFDARVQEADKPVTIIFTGVNGVGKTTSIAKMARYFEERGLSTVMANGDTYRAGANEQIRKHADNLGTRLISHEQGGDPAAVIYDAVEYAEAHDVDVVLGDTAGRLHTSNDLMAQLEKIERVVDPDMTLFVDEAVAGQDAVQRAKKFNEAAEIDGAILTKADADSQGGAAISIAYVTGKPVLFLGVGQGYDDLARFDPEELVASLLGDE